MGRLMNFPGRVDPHRGAAGSVDGADGPPSNKQIGLHVDETNSTRNGHDPRRPRALAPGAVTPAP